MNRRQIDPWRPLAVSRERERRAGGRLTSGVTVFLAGSECPFSCVFCDLWRYTLEEATPVGAIVAQVEVALADLPASAGRDWIKLYNASNFFDRRAVPAADRLRLPEMLAAFERVIVECHPRLIGDDCLAFAASLDGELEVAMGLETIHPELLPRLDKGMELADFEVACRRLRQAGVHVRAFVLVGIPWLSAAEGVEWAVRSTAWALDRGVETVALIPLRGGTGEMERLAARGDWIPPTLAQFEAACDRASAIAGDGVVLADLWDIERLPACAACCGYRTERLREMNRSGRTLAAVSCADCGW